MALPIFDKQNKTTQKSNQQWCLGFLILPAEIYLVTDGQHISSRTVARQAAICLTANSGLWVRRPGCLCLAHLFLTLLSKLIHVSASLSLCKMVKVI